LLQAENDDVDYINNSLVYYVALKDAGVRVEMHVYAQGGQAFGAPRFRSRGSPGWSDLAGDDRDDCEVGVTPMISTTMCHFAD
jgi:hypothetical protein